jgi:environmental stress-induced protein Ves
VSWRLVHLGDVPPSPWRNGGGVTRELASWPDTGDWVWRMSVAEVARSGPFSRFEGVQRWFAVLGGRGVRLSMGDQAHELTGNSVPLCFDGAMPADCQLLDGATQDFNLMVRRDQAAAQMRRISGGLCIVLNNPKTIALYAINSGASVQFDQNIMAVPAHSLVWQALPAGAALQVSAADALWMDIEL